MWVNENQLDQWVRGNAREAQGRIVELVWRLVAASAPNPRERRFPLGDSIGQHGPDGVLDTDFGLDPFVPEGRSYWEIGTGNAPAAKATRDYQDLVDSIPEAERKNATFVFVTPLSGVKGWEHTWKKDAQARWLDDRRKRGEWKDVRIIDGTRLIEWVSQFPSVELWLAQATSGLMASQVEIPEGRWDETRSIGEPPPLVPKLFLVNREEARAKLTQVFDGTTTQLKLETRYPEQVVDFVCAHLAELDEESRVDASSRCVIVSGIDAWNSLVGQRERLILVAAPQLDLSGDTGTRLIQKARRGNHAVIFAGPPGGIPDPTSAPLRPPSVQQIQDALEQAGYTEQRARTLAQKSGGHLGSLLRCLQNLSVLPEWAEGSAAAELVIAALLGGWNEQAAGDRSIVEDLAGNPYGEWIGRVREAALRSGTPLIQHDGRWKFVARFEGWYALGPRIFDEHLDRFRTAAIAVLQEDDPQFDLPTEERYAAAIHGKVLGHSRRLRSGLAESLALLGSHSSALTSCSTGKAEATAFLCIRELLSNADWRRWASLDDVLPLLAEAAPHEFLACVETVLDTRPEVFEALYAQEGGPVTGRTYLTGILWALETLAWDPAHLGRVVLLLGGLATLDPGGKWANRPDNTLRTILLPWLPQTCASIAQRSAAVTALLRENPAVGWKLLLELLPHGHSHSSYTRRPAWRTTIPDDWKPGASAREYWDQVQRYAAMVVGAAKQDLGKFVDLLRHWTELPSNYQDELIAYLSSSDVGSLPETIRQELWSGLSDVVSKHRRFSGAKWAMEPARVDRLAELATRLAPLAPGFRHRRLFSERASELFEERGNYEEQYQRVENLRREAVAELSNFGGAEAVLEFARAVESPWRVGTAFGSVADELAGAAVLPRLLLSEEQPIAQFVGGFVWGRYAQGGWSWVDETDTSQWSSDEVGQFFSFLPFVKETWDRVEMLPGDSQSTYWRNTAANPYPSSDGDLDYAVEKLLQAGRAHAAIRCLYHLVSQSRPIDHTLAVLALLAALTTSDDLQSIHTYATVEIIKALQGADDIVPADMFRIEWAYLPLLDEHHDASPRFLAERLSQDPVYFCELVRLVFRPKGVDAPADGLDEQARLIATNGYRLLDEWHIPPGSRDDGTIDGRELTDWMDTMKREAASTGHLEIAMTLVGQVLTYAPSDPDGLWIDRSVADVLNAKDAGDLRDGFRIQILNSRGVHWIDPTGAPERALAAEYHAKAAEVEEAGYHRVATVLREIAESYEREAKQIVQEHTLRTEL